jgi:hypothetical protein
VLGETVGDAVVLFLGNLHDPSSHYLSRMSSFTLTRPRSDVDRPGGMLGGKSFLESTEGNGGELLAAHAQLFVHSDFFEGGIRIKFLSGT